MKENMKNKITVFLMGGVLLVLSLVCWFKPSKEYSDSERRTLAKFPELTEETILSGRFMKDYPGPVPSKGFFTWGKKLLHPVSVSGEGNQ